MKIVFLQLINNIEVIWARMLKINLQCPKYRMILSLSIKTAHLKPIQI